jgi:hypothetical protein
MVTVSGIGGETVPENTLAMCFTRQMMMMEVRDAD